MIVGTKAVPLDKLYDSCSNIQTLQAFAISLVPRCIRHVQEIIDNQKYIVAIEVRSMNSIPFKVRMKLANDILEGVTIRGDISKLMDLEDILTQVNFDLLMKVLFKEELSVVK